MTSWSVTVLSGSIACAEAIGPSNRGHEGRALKERGGESTTALCIQLPTGQAPLCSLERSHRGIYPVPWGTVSVFNNNTAMD